jgi:hypothetical protein
MKHKTPVDPNALTALMAGGSTHELLRAISRARRGVPGVNPLDVFCPLLLDPDKRVNGAALRGITSVVQERTADLRKLTAEIVTSARRDGILSRRGANGAPITITDLRVLAASPLFIDRIEAAALAPACKGQDQTDEHGGPAQVVVGLAQDPDYRVVRAAASIGLTMLRSRPNEFRKDEAGILERAAGRVAETERSEAAKLPPPDPHLSRLSAENLQLRRTGLR